MQIVAGHITLDALTAMAEATFGDLVKAVNGSRGLLAVDGPAARAAIEELVGKMVVP